MRIKQCFCGARSFMPHFLKKYNLRDYDNTKEPSIFFGLYPRQREIIKKHKAPAVIIWTGSDALYFHTYPIILNLVKDRPNTYFVAISNFIEDDMRKFGLKFKSIPITPHTYENIKPEPLGNSVYMYTAPTKTEFYGEPYFFKVKALMPEIKFHLCTLTTYTREELIEIYKDCFIGLRLIKHDGLSNTVIEMGMMGRRVIWNGGSPNALKWLENPQAIANTIRREKERQKNKYESVAKSVMEYMTQPTDWLNLEFHV